MANDYLKSIHTYLNEQIKLHQTHQSGQAMGGHPGHQAYHQGGLAELRELRKFLAHNFDLTTQTYDR